MSKKGNVSLAKHVKAIESGTKNAKGKVALGFHFSHSSRMARDGRTIIEGKIYTPRHGRVLVPEEHSHLCGAALHASPTPFDALQHCSWPGVKTLSYVLVRGVNGADPRKFSGYSREHLKVVELDIEKRMKIAHAMGGGEMVHKDSLALEVWQRSQINTLCRSWLDHPEVYVPR